MDHHTDQTDVIFSVSEFIESLNAALKQLRAKIIGEVINVKYAASGHVYFTLKDKEANAVIDCIMWKYNYLINGVKIENGLELILTGNPNVYAQQGRLSFIAQTVEHVGEGALKKAYLELKQKLTQDGLLDPDRKRPLPEFPQKIGIITSIQGAVIHDFENNIQPRGYKIKLIDTRVEGKEALHDVLSSIKRMEKEQLDILVIMRGGGSFQALATFDNEAVVRAVADFPTPVIAAIGHHQDVPLTALAADCAVSTPTAAANILDHSWTTAEKAIHLDQQRILHTYADALNGVAMTIQFRKEAIAEKFGRILYIFHESETQLKNYLTRMHETLHAHNTLLATMWQSRFQTAYKYALTQYATNLVHSEQLIQIHNPLRILKQGYSVMRKAGRVVKLTKDVTIGDTIEVLLSDGTVISTVEKTKQTHGKTN